MMSYFKKMTIVLLFFVVFITGGILSYYQTPVYYTYVKDLCEGLRSWKIYLFGSKLDEIVQSPNMNKDISEVTPEIKATTYNKDLIQDGYTFFTVDERQEVLLTDMNGSVVHKWRLPAEEIWKDHSHAAFPHLPRKIVVRNAHPFKNGDVLVLYISSSVTPWGYGLAKLDKDSNLLWKYDDQFHHDIDVDENGRVYSLVHGLSSRNMTSKEKVSGGNFDVLDGYNYDPLVIEDYLMILDEEGRRIKKLSLYEMIENSDYKNIFRISHPATQFVIPPPPRQDLLHTNTVNLIGEEEAKHHPFLKPGYVCVYFREQATIAVIDPEEEKIVWANHGPWLIAHEPRFLENGNVLIFDNKGNIRTEGGSVRAVEFDPVTLEIVWEYSGSNEHPIASEIGGNVARLSNGNTLISSYLMSKIFEVTPDKQLVWELSVENIPKLSSGERYDSEYFEFLKK